MNFSGAFKKAGTLKSPDCQGQNRCDVAASGWQKRLCSGWRCLKTYAEQQNLGAGTDDSGNDRGKLSADRAQYKGAVECWLSPLDKLEGFRFFLLC